MYKQLKKSYSLQFIFFSNKFFLNKLTKRKNFTKYYFIVLFYDRNNLNEHTTKLKHNKKTSVN